jgi:flagellar biosynthesis/type III secretory pathway chaperone
LLNTVITQLHQVLDQERQALISADFEALAAFVSQKEDLLAQLDKTIPAKEVLRPIRQKMDENLALLAAAIKGVAAAGERLAALQNVKNGLSVYDNAGRLAHVRTHNPALEKKA